MGFWNPKIGLLARSACPLSILFGTILLGLNAYSDASRERDNALLNYAFTSVDKSNLGVLDSGELSTLLSDLGHIGPLVESEKYSFSVSHGRDVRLDHSSGQITLGRDLLREYFSGRQE